MSPGGEKLIPYTENEKLLLASLVDKHKNVIENKKTDSATIQRKQQEWDKVAEEYNCQANMISTRRTATQLKKLWSNLKQRKRKATTELKYNRLLTGGGPEPQEDLDPVMEAVNLAAPHADVSLSCPWDSTAVFEKKTVEQYAGSVNTSTPLSAPASGKHISAEIKSTIAVVQTEANLRVQKIREFIKQQEELHKLKMQIDNEQLQVTIATRKKIEAERELAVLQLELFKAKHNL